MYRHHPYGGGAPHAGGGGGFESPRRNAPLGPDRSHSRLDRSGPPRGRGRGRGNMYNGGGGGGYDASYGEGTAAYDQGPPQGDGAPGHNEYDSSYGATGAYGAAPYANRSDDFGSQGQGYGGFEDGPDFDDGTGRGRKRRPERDDKVHDSIIEERINRERPCRTLFIRNIKYETDPTDVRRQFEEHGDVKTFFDLIGNRGMVFVTYFDLRAAERARDRLQGSEISGRPIDVHYSLPRDDGSKGDSAKNLEYQGCLIAALRGSQTNAAIDEGELRRRMQQYGDVKSIRPKDGHPDQRYVEFYDLRACDETFDRLRNQPFQDGIIEIDYAWDPQADSGEPKRGGFDRGGRGRGGRGRGGRGRGGMDDWDRRDDWSREPRRGPPARFDDGYGPPRDGYGGSGGPRYDDRSNGYGPPPPGPSAPGPYVGDMRPGPPNGYGPGPGSGPGPAGPPSGFAPPPPTGGPGADDRLEQARKVQQLLAALKQPGGPTAPPSGPPSAAPAAPPPGPSSYYPPSQPSYPNAMPPFPPNGAPVPPPAVLAMLQQANAGQTRPPGQVPPYPGLPPPGGPGYSQLMSYLQNAMPKHS